MESVFLYSCSGGGRFNYSDAGAHCMGGSGRYNGILCSTCYATYMGKKWKIIVVRAFALGLCVIILFPVVFSAVRWLPPLRHHPVWYAGEWSEDRVYSFDPPDSEQYTCFDEFMDLLLDRAHIINSTRNAFALRAYAAEKDCDRIVEWSGPENLTRTLRIRLAIYRAYLEDLNWLGHDSYCGHYYISDLYYYVWHPQNVWIVGQFVLFMFFFVQHPQFSAAENDILCDKETL